MANAVNPVPERYGSITPNLVSSNAVAAIEYYKNVFGATEVARMPGPDGKIMHAELKIGDRILFINDSMGPAPAGPEPGKSNLLYLHVYVPDADAVFGRAVAGGARVDMPIADMFWGDRYGKITDPFGQQWGIATHIEDVPVEELPRRQREFMAKIAAAGN